MPDGFEVFLSETSRIARDELPLHLRYAYEDALSELEADPTPANPLVVDAGDGYYMIDHRGVIVLFEFENALVVRIFGVFAVFGW